MRFLRIFLYVLLASAGMLTAEEERVQGNFFVRFPNRFEETPHVLEELQLLERLVRQMGRFDGAGSSRGFVVVLDRALAPAQWRWQSAKARLELHVSADFRDWIGQDQPGREIVFGLIRSRMTPDPGADAANWPGWITAGLWAEFQAWRECPLHLVRSTWLPLLRKAVADGGRAGVNAVTLQGAMGSLGAAGRALYLERARLMIAVSARLSAGRQNLLADYLELGRRREMTQEACFRAVFESAALKRVGKVLEQLLPEGETPTGTQALEWYMERELFSPYAPLPGRTVRQRLEEIGRVFYRRGDGAPLAEAALEDLPRLVARYASCAGLPRRKIAALNQLSMVSPGAVRERIFALTELLASPDGNLDKAEAEIRTRWQALLAAAIWQEETDALLDGYEMRRRPMLYDHRMFLDAAARRTVLPSRLRKMMDHAEEQ